MLDSLEAKTPSMDDSGAVPTLEWDLKLKTWPGRRLQIVTTNPKESFSP